jgi:hypothetical protein
MIAELIRVVLDKTNRGAPRIVLTALVSLLCVPGACRCEDTAGVMLTAQGLSQENLVAAEWSASFPGAAGR